MIKDLNKIAREIIKNNQYLTLATVDKDLGTWICVLTYAFDKDWNFYFSSIDSSQHSINIANNNKVTFAIYDSRQNWGTGIGLQIEGIVEKIKISELPNATKSYFFRKWPYGSISGAFAVGFKKLLKNKTYNFYKIVSKKVWMNNPNAEVDERVIINL